MGRLKEATAQRLNFAKLKESPPAFAISDKEKICASADIINGLEKINSDTMFIFIVENDFQAKVLEAAFKEKPAAVISICGTFSAEKKQKFFQCLETVKFKTKPDILILFDFGSNGSYSALKFLSEIEEKFGYGVAFDFYEKKIWDMLIEGGAEKVFIETVTLLNRHF